MNYSKRSFFKRGFLAIVRETRRAFQDGMREAELGINYDRFFESYESSYPLTLGYPDDILFETAKRAGIKTEGREKRDIVKELFEKKGAF
ncbi:MAG: hypothetical protein ACPL7J_05300 [Desulfomonilaceae bacterium]